MAAVSSDLVIGVPEYVVKFLTILLSEIVVGRIRTD